MRIPVACLAVIGTSSFLLGGSAVFLYLISYIRHNVVQQVFRTEQ
jgi:hypothetical protein